MPDDFSYKTALSTRTVGLLALAFLFCAAAALAFAYFASRTHAPAQTASVAAIDPFASIVLEAKAAYVVDLSTGQTLFARNAEAQLPLASLTKVPLTLAVAEVLPLEGKITIPYDTGYASNSGTLRSGEVWNVRDVITFTLVVSSNEGSEMLAAAAESGIRAKYPAAPLEGATLWRMNALAQELGLTHTYFLNVSGLDMSTTQSGSYGSARDMAKLFAYAASTSRSLFEGTAHNGLLLTSIGGAQAEASNTNTALGELHGVILGKTGFTDLAGGNLAIVFDVGFSHPVVAVVLGSSEEGRFADMKKLVEAANLAVAGKQP